MTEPPVATLQTVVLDAPDPLALGRFYAALIGGEINRPDPRWWLDDDWVTLHLPDGAVPCFQRAPGQSAGGGAVATRRCPSSGRSATR